MKWNIGKLFSAGRGGIEETIAFVFILVACIPIVAIGWRSLVLIAESHQRDVARIESESAKRLSTDITSFMDGLLGTISIKAEALEGVDISKSVSKWQESLAKGLLVENQNIRMVRFASPDGVESYVAARDYATSGTLHVSALPGFKTALGGKSYIGPVYFTEQGPRVSIAAPITTNDQVIQVVMAEIDLEPVSRYVRRTSAGTTGYAVLISKEGSVIASGTGVEVGKKIQSWGRVAELQKGMTFTALSDEDVYRSPLSGQETIGYGTLIPSLGWGVLIEWPLEDANAVFSRIILEIMLGALISIILVFILAPLAAARLVRPIRKLEEAAKQVEEGNLAGEVRIETKDEFEDLGNAFNKMMIGLRRLEELKNEFVFIAAHELRAPVTAIKGYISLINEEPTPLPDTVRKFLGVINESNSRLITLIEDLLNIARSDAGKLSIDVSPVDITAATKNILAALGSLAMEKHIELSYAPPEPYRVLANTDRLGEVLTNLLSNAIKYNKDGGRVEITHTIVGDMLQTSISDTGIGMTEEDLHHLFEKFFRTEVSRKTNAPSTGLGLFITRQLVEKMGGTMSATATLGQGSTFSFKLRRVA